MDNFFDKVAALWQKFKGYFVGLAADWKGGRKPRAVGKVILPLVPVALAVALLVFLWSIRETIKWISGLLLTVWAIAYMCMPGRDKNGQPQQSTEVVMKNAQEGLETLLDHIFLVSESLAEQTEIYSPKTKGGLAFPDKKRCITIEDGVAVITVQLHYAGEELDAARFLERFNQRMAQKLNNGELTGKPPAVFTDSDNNAHTAIQAIRCIPVKGEQTIRLEVIRVNQAALALLDKVDREKAPKAGGEAQLYDDDL